MNTSRSLRAGRIVQVAQEIGELERKLKLRHEEMDRLLGGAVPTSPEKKKPKARPQHVTKPRSRHHAAKANGLPSCSVRMVAVLTEAQAALRLQDIVRKLKCEYHTASATMSKLVKDGAVRRVGRGLYTVVQKPPPVATRMLVESDAHEHRPRTHPHDA